MRLNIFILQLFDNKIYIVAHSLSNLVVLIVNQMKFKYNENLWNVIKL